MRRLKQKESKVKGKLYQPDKSNGQQRSKLRQAKETLVKSLHQQPYNKKVMGFVGSVG